MIINNPDYLVTIVQAPDPKTPGSLGATVVAPLPPELAYDTAAEYQAPFAQGMLSGGAFMQAAAAAGIRLATQAMTAQLWQGSTENEINLDLEFQTENDPIADVRDPVLQLQKFAAASVDSATGLLKSPGPRIDLSTVASASEQALTQAGEAGKQAMEALKSVIGIVGQVQTNKNLNNSSTSLNSQQQGAKTQPEQNGLGGAQFWKKNIVNNISIQIGRYAFFDSVVILNAQTTWSHEIDMTTGLPMHAKVSLRFKPLFLVTQEDLQQIFGGRQ